MAGKPITTGTRAWASVIQIITGQMKTYNSLPIFIMGKIPVTVTAFGFITTIVLYIGITIKRTVKEFHRQRSALIPIMVFKAAMV